MGDITDILPKETQTVQAIYDWHKENGDAEAARGYLGASILGRSCDRQLWYTFRFCFKSEISGRIYRLFRTGHLEEPRFVEELKGIGCTVHELDPETGQQFEVKFACGHGGGHMDGCALGLPEAPKTWHVLEMKTMGGTEDQKSKDFEKVKKVGVQKAKPEHYAQMQAYMGHTGMTRAMYLCKKKATDEIHSERIKFDPKYFKWLMERAERIITAAVPPERCSDRPDTFACKFCDAYKLCWGTSDVAVPLPCKSCRTCCHATPEMDEGEDWGRWSCSKHGRDVSEDEQYVGCDSHLLIPHLVSFAEPSDSGDDWIEFKNDDDGAVWRHGLKEGYWSTEELMKTPGPIVGEPAVNAVKEAFEGEVCGFEVPELTLLEKYPPEDSEKLWDGPPEHSGNAICKIMGTIDMEGIEPTAALDDEAHTAVEFANQFLVVIYKEHNHVAIWKGKE